MVNQNQNQTFNFWPYKKSLFCYFVIFNYLFYSILMITDRVFLLIIIGVNDGSDVVFPLLYYDATNNERRREDIRSSQSKRKHTRWKV